MATIEIWAQQPESEPATSNDAHAELAALYRELRPRLLNRVRFKWRIRGELAEDLVHDAWVRAIEHIDRFDRDRPFEPWALRILDNVVIDHLRRSHTVDGRARQLSVELDDLRLEVSTGPVQEADRVGDRDLLSRAMASLPPRQQATAVRVLVDGLSLDETADSMELSNTACRQLLHRARIGLRRALLDQGMLPGLAPGLWLRQRWLAFARRVGVTETSAAAGSTATVVALALTVTVTLGAGDAIARAKLDLGQEATHAADAEGVTAAREGDGQPQQQHTRPAPIVKRASTSRRSAHSGPAASTRAGTAPLVAGPSAEVPVAGTRVHQTALEDPDYEYGVNVQVKPRTTGGGAGAKVSVRDNRADNGPIEDAAGVTACQVVAAAPTGYCTTKSEAP